MMNPDDVSRVATLAVGLIPGLSLAAPLAGEAVKIGVSIVERLIDGESLAQIEADPPKYAAGIDSAKLLADIEFGI